MTEKLELEFERIRQECFPDLRDGGEWQVQRYDGKGYCDRETKTIKVGEPTKDYSLPVLLIHELAHAVTTNDHGSDWIERMNEVAKQADEVGDTELARELRSHVDWVAGPNAHDVTEEEVYGAIGDAARDQPNASFEDVIGWVAQGYGQDLATFVKEFPKSQEEYDEAHELLRKQDDLRRKLRGEK